MSLLDYFRISKAGTASVAKERLQILVAHERSSRNQPSYLPQLQKELLEVIQKYINVGQDAISVNFEQDENQETLELNIVLPDLNVKTLNILNQHLYMGLKMLNIIGDAAGKIWQYLDQNGAASVTKITNETGINKNEVQRAIGWLLKEDKLSIEVVGRTETLSLK